MNQHLDKDKKAGKVKGKKNISEMNLDEIISKFIAKDS